MHGFHVLYATQQKAKEEKTPVCQVLPPSPLLTLNSGSAQSPVKATQQCTLGCRAPSITASLKTRAFYLHTTSHDNTQLLSSSFASPTLTLLHLVLSRCGQSNEQNVLEPGTRGLSSLDVSIRKTSEDGLGAQRIRHRIFLSREKKISLRIGERIRQPQKSQTILPILKRDVWNNLKSQKPIFC